MSDAPSTARRLPAGRKMALADYVHEVEQVTVAELALHFGVSPDTVRRDLDALDAEGIVRRTHGGAISAQRVAAVDTPYPRRFDVQAEAKQRIARRAVRLLHDDQTLLVNGGTTTLAVMPLLSELRGLTVVTNSLLVPPQLPTSSFRELYLIGGIVRPSSHVTLGPVELPGYGGGLSSHRIKADVALLGVGGVSVELGYSTSNVTEARMMREFVRSASRVVVLADSTKLGHSRFSPMRLRCDKCPVLRVAW